MGIVSFHRSTSLNNYFLWICGLAVLIIWTFLPNVFIGSCWRRATALVTKVFLGSTQICWLSQCQGWIYHYVPTASPWPSISTDWYYMLNEISFFHYNYHLHRYVFQKEWHQLWASVFVDWRTWSWRLKCDKGGVLLDYYILFLRIFSDQDLC